MARAVVLPAAEAAAARRVSDHPEDKVKEPSDAHWRLCERGIIRMVNEYDGTRGVDHWWFYFTPDGERQMRALDKLARRRA